MVAVVAVCTLAGLVAGCTLAQSVGAARLQYK